MKIAKGGPDFDQAIADYVQSNLPQIAGRGRFKPFRSFAFVVGGKVIGGFVLTKYTGFDAHLTIFAERPRFVGHHALAECYRWAFDELGLVRLTCHVDPANSKALNAALKTGFKREGLIRKGYDGVNDAIALGMLREDCAFLKGTSDGHS